MQVEVKRKDSRFFPDPSRVIARFCYFSNERSKNIILNVLAMSDYASNYATIDLNELLHELKSSK
jgi:hypothetical protein